MNKIVFVCFVTLAVMAIVEAAPEKRPPGSGVPATVSPSLVDNQGCPVLASGMMGLCVDKCINGCPDGWLCCGNGCGRYCYDPINMVGNN